MARKSVPSAIEPQGSQEGEENAKEGKAGGNTQVMEEEESASARRRKERGGSGQDWFNPEELTEEKRKWGERQGEDRVDSQAASEPPLMDRLLVVGLPPEAASSVAARAPDARTAKRARTEGSVPRAEAAPNKEQRPAHKSKSGPSYQPEVLLKYPPGPSNEGWEDRVADFCFPAGLVPRMVERTPSRSALNEVVYRQAHAHGDSPSFVFFLRTWTGAIMYGVCAHVDEIVQRPPPMVSSAAKAAVNESKRVTSIRDPGKRLDSLHAKWPSSRLSKFVVVAPRAYCIISRHPFFRLHLDVLTTIIGLDRLQRISLSHFDPDLAGERGREERPGESGGTTNGVEEESTSSAGCDVVRTLQFDDAGNELGPASDGGSPSSSSQGQVPWERKKGELERGFEEASDAMSAMENLSDALAVAGDYRRRFPPAPGGRMSVAPIGSGASINFVRGQEGDEEGREWAVAALCRSMSLENVVAFLHYALLERQIVVVTPSLSLLAACVLAAAALVRPLEWQSVLLPVLPERFRDVLEAPVPFIVGLPRKSEDISPLIRNIARVNVYKDAVKPPSGFLPGLPKRSELLKRLRPHFDRMQSHRPKGGPVMEQAEGALGVEARAFMQACRDYVHRELLGDIRSHAITDVSNSARPVGILLTDSFVDSFSPSNRAFGRQLAETQMLSAFCDSVLASHCR